jgi:hypothetical protein
MTIAWRFQNNSSSPPNEISFHSVASPQSSLVDNNLTANSIIFAFSISNQQFARQTLRLSFAPMELELPTDVLKLIANYNSRILRLFELVNRSLNTWAKSFRVPASQAAKDLLSQFPFYHTDDQSWDGYKSIAEGFISTEKESLAYRIGPSVSARAQTLIFFT